MSDSIQSSSPNNKVHCFPYIKGTKMGVTMNEICFLMKTVGNCGLWKYFVESGQKINSRAKHVMNLGVTSLKCHCYKHLSVIGNVAPDMISTSTKEYRYSKKLLTSIGKILIYISKNILPQCSSKDRFC